MRQPDAVVTVALVEDDPGMRERLSHALASNPAVQLAHAAETCAGILEWLRGHQPDVLLVDLGLPDGSGIDVIRRCRDLAPRAEVMVITLFGDEANMIRAFEAGARGYLLKDGTEEDLSQHVLNLHAGGSPMSPIIARRLLVRMNDPAGGRIPQAAAPSVPASASERLSPRETEILTLLARGYTYPELAVHSKTEAVYEARQLGLLDR
jgi:DNA-binding NarL/FixJ family response regulator